MIINFKTCTDDAVYLTPPEIMTCNPKNLAGYMQLVVKSLKTACIETNISLLQYLHLPFYCSTELAECLI